MRGRFVVFEGIDGSGKSSTLSQVAAALRPQHPDLAVTREETDSPLGEAVRQAIASGSDPLAVTYLFLADRAQHVQDIRAHLEAGRHVLCDRFSLSTYAYQSVTLRGRVPDPVAFLRALHAPLGLEPDHVLLFVADPQRCVDRTRRRGRTSPYEKVAFLAEVQARYQALAAGDPRVQAIDAERDITNLASDATAIVSGWLKAPSARRVPAAPPA